MVYKFVMISDEVEDFRREIYINSDATFKELSDIILSCVGYKGEEMTSFLICDDDWETIEEITLLEMDTTPDKDSYVMDRTYIDEFVEEKGQKLMYVFDPYNQRSFYMELKDIKLNESLDKPVCKVKKGKAPAQMLDNLFMEDAASAKGGFDMSEFEEFNEVDGYDEDEISDYGLDEGSMM